MTPLEYMESQAEQNRAKLERAEQNGNIPDKDLENIRAKIGYYEAAVRAMEKEGDT